MMLVSVWAVLVLGGTALAAGTAPDTVTEKAAPRLSPGMEQLLNDIRTLRRTRLEQLNAEIDQMIELAGHEQVTLCTYGDMMRVVGRSGTLADARAAGADVRVIYSALDAVRLAVERPTRQVVFIAIGFETTTPATAVAVREAAARGLKNFSVLTSHKMILPAMRALLDSGDVRVAGFVLPGHVSIITGSDLFRPIVDEYHLPCIITGFEGEQILAALARLTELAAAQEATLENLYPQAVTRPGNRVAQRLIEMVFEPADVCWRGLGNLPASGLRLRTDYARYDARLRFGLPAAGNHEPPGCRCGDVITARATPADCRLFGTVCTPVHAIGPCMVSSEGTCQAWFRYHRAETSKSGSQVARKPVRRAISVSAGRARSASMLSSAPICETLHEEAP